MIVIETLEDGRTHTYSDAGFKIRQLVTGIVYGDAVDATPRTYTETDIPLDDVELTDAEALQIITGVSE